MAEKGTILVVDNESDQLEMMKEVLGRIGFDARTTDNPMPVPATWPPVAA